LKLDNLPVKHGELNHFPKPWKSAMPVYLLFSKPWKNGAERLPMSETFM